MSPVSKGLLTGAVTGLLGLLLYLTPAGTFLERHLGLDLLFNLRGTVDAPDEVVVISIDKASARALELPARPVHWPRDLHARAIDILSRRGVKAVAFDVLFRQPGDKDQTDALARAIAGAGNVVLFQYLDKQVLAGATVETLVPPVSPVGASALALAPFPLPKVPAKISSYWLFKDSVGSVPTMPAVMLQLYLIEFYPQWRALVTGLRADLDAELPIDTDTLLANQGLVPFMVQQRQLLQDNDFLAERMEEMITGGGYAPAPRRALSALLSLYTGDNTRLINFHGPARSIRTIPFHRLLDGDGDPEALRLDLRGKAVFIGLSEPLQLERIDTFYTPFSQDDGVDVSGVEIMAGAFANLLHQRELRGVSLPWVVLLLLTLPMLAALLPRLTTSTLAAIGGAALLGLFYAFAATGLFKQSLLWIPVWIPMTLMLPIALFASFFWKYLDTHREKERIRRAFGYYLPENVIDEMARSFTDLHRQRQLLLGTCLATDAARYTALAEQLGPARLTRLMDQYYAGLFAPVREHNGVVSDVVGDAMMAFWTDTHNGKSHPRLACQAALAIATLSPEFSVDGTTVRLETRIGLHTGEMLVGNIGALNHYEYRAVGDITNTAHRLQALAKRLGQSLLVSGQTLDGAGPGLASRDLGRFLLPGKSQPVAVHALLPGDPAAWPAAAEAAFAEALALFRQRHWREAAAAFQVLQTRYQDTAAGFYHLQSVGLMANEPADDWLGEVCVPEK